ncbi:prepilin peptidase [Pseudonocardia kunmingensis]|uniref:Type IV leader peptidase family protein n=1 Tax=Pseudonocardia kunmingensis TaxID=630975 RepID=A0A543DNU8_9PSEU|nr:prepilin peptidase [Pseudonocardia kunmingensis]TQM11010.1 type IV leader peptidase family protein [Pseudonocardia kunmingensis]
MTTVHTAVVLAMIAGPAGLLLAQRTMHVQIALRPVEVATVTAVTGTTVAVAIARPPADVAVLLPLAVLGSAAAVVDAREGRLPDALTGPLLVATLLIVLLTGGGVIGAAVGAGAAGALKLVASAAIGWGDVKLVPTLAVVLTQYDAVASGIINAALLVAATAIIVSVATPGHNVLVPYGPALVFGTVGAAGF